MARVLPLVTDWNRFYWTSGADGPPAVPALRRLRIACSTRRRRSAADADPNGLEVRRGVRRRGGPELHHEHPAVVTRLCRPPIRWRWWPSRRTPDPADDQHRRVRRPTRVHVGMPVRVAFEQVEDVWLPLFEPTGRAAGGAARRGDGPGADPIGASDGAASRSSRTTSR